MTVANPTADTSGIEYIPQVVINNNEHYLAWQLATMPGPFTKRAIKEAALISNIPVDYLFEQDKYELPDPHELLENLAHLLEKIPTVPIVSVPVSQFLHLYCTAVSCAKLLQQIKQTDSSQMDVRLQAKALYTLMLIANKHETAEEVRGDFLEIALHTYVGQLNAFVTGHTAPNKIISREWGEWYWKRWTANYPTQKELDHALIELERRIETE